MDNNTDYNQISHLYHFTKTNPIKKYSEAFTFFQVLGNIKHKSVLDCACGDGYYTRLIKDCGAARVVGVDISEKMIARARDKTNCHSHGILYDILDMSQEKQIGLFDMVTSVYLFPYAQTRQTLSRMCKTMTMNLKPDGKMVSVTLNPLLTYNCLDIQEQYGAKMIAQGPLIDGTSIQVILRTSQGNINLCNTYWTKKTYEQLLVAAGFSSIVWHQPRISPAGLETHGNDYWQNHLIHPGFSILKCQR